MRLDELIAPIGLVGISADGTEASEPGGETRIGSLAYDSRRVRPGSLFFCVTGFSQDGHDFAAQALADGAVALVVERRLHLGVPEVLVASTRAAMGPVAARFYGDPSKRMTVIGITGTNGKTTTAFLVRALLEATGTQCGLLGTIRSVIGGVERPAERTTPEAIDLHGTLRAMLDGGDQACAMEVSSHALALGRVAEVRFAGAVFTNLTQDHLDFHDSMEDYYAAKRRLFGSPSVAEGKGAAVNVVNLDDPYGQRLAGELEQTVTYAIDHRADYRAQITQMDRHGARLALQSPAGERTLTLPLPGRFNVYNALAALASVHALGYDLDALVAALEAGVHVPGRFESLDAGQEFTVLVDYAHTPDSLENVLLATRELAPGRVICVFGAGGDRDRGKRPLMGQIAARLADVTIVTSDNPRSESPQAIIQEILQGIPAERLTADGPVQVQVDRRAAIVQALELAQPHDVVVIAGKGHEQGQELANRVKLPFDDATIAREALQAILTPNTVESTRPSR